VAGSRQRQRCLELLKKKGCHFHEFSLFSAAMAPCGAKGQIGFASFITGQKTNKQHWRNR
jgi:hypothetical protein